MSTKNDDGIGVLLEQVIHQNQVILESLTDMQKNARRIPKIEKLLKDIIERIDAIKKTVRDTNKQVRDHELRLTSLEERVA